jgi:succinate dehydrogenase / fumarate reductase cytochrome b subunit
MAEQKAPVREQPVSPHLSVWRWHITMAASILNRVTGVGLYIGALVVAAWAVALASGPDAYGQFKGLMGTPLGKFVMFGFGLSFFYHLASGIRHSIWDLGYGLEVKKANALAAASFAFAIAATVAVWAIASMTGAV